MRKDEYTKLLIAYYKPKYRGYSEKSARFQSQCRYFFNILAMSFNISGFFQPLHCYKIFLKGWKMKMKWKLLSDVQLFATPWTVHGILQARLLEWVAVPCSRGPSQPRDQTQVSRISGGFFTCWVTWEVSTKIIYQYCVLEKCFTSWGFPGRAVVRPPAVTAEELNVDRSRDSACCVAWPKYKLWNVYTSKLTSESLTLWNLIL